MKKRVEIHLPQPIYDIVKEVADKRQISIRIAIQEAIERVYSRKEEE